MKVSAGGWTCIWKGAKIDVIQDAGVGSYELLRNPFCARCARPNVEEPDCGFHWFIDEALERVHAVSIYYTLQDQRDNLISRHILRFKDQRDYAFPLGLAMALYIRKIAPELSGYDAIVPVPIHPDKRLQRGYDQAEEMAKVLSCQIGVRVITPIRKVTNLSLHTVPTLPDKIAQVKGLYECAQELSAKKVLLIDDTATTGLDLGECAKALKEKGSSQIRGLVAGRTVLRY